MPGGRGNFSLLGRNNGRVFDDGISLGWGDPSGQLQRAADSGRNGTKV